MIRLRTLGSLQIQDGDGADFDPLLAQSRRVALLAYLALAVPRGFHRRDRLLALFWPEHDDAHARNALSQSVHVLRRALGANAILSRADDEVGLDWSALWCDAIAFGDALDAGRIAEAVELYRGPVLDGFHVSNGAPELDRWIEAQREHYARRFADAVERMADSCQAAGDMTTTVLWRRRLATLDPFSSRGALGLMRALVAAGEPAQALQHARVHETLLRQELEATPDPAITALVREIAAPRETIRRAVPSESARHPTEPESPGVSVRAMPNRRRRPALRFVSLVGVVVFATAGGLALSHARNTTGVPAISCLAVLPLANLSRDSTQEYLADGVTDALITELARFERPIVISRTSTSRYKKTKSSAPEIARQLNCDALVEGTVMREGDRVRVSARLVHAPTDRQLWSESYERDVTDLLLLERQVAVAIAGQVRAVVASGDSASDFTTRHVDPVTYAMYLRGRDAFASRNPASLNQALALFKQAIARDSAFALAYSGLSDTYRMLGGLGYAPASFYTDSAVRLANRAVGLDDKSSEAHTSLGSTLTDQANWPRAEAEFRRAIALRPGNALAHHWYAALLVTLDRKDEALREIRRASELDPLSQAIQGLKGQIMAFARVVVPRGRPGDRKALVDPTHPGTIAQRSLNLARNKRCPEAYTENQNAQALAPNVTMIRLSLVGVHILCGQREKARVLLDTIELRSDARLMSAYIASIHVALGQRDSAFAWLEHGQWGMQGRMELRMSPQLDPLRADPRFAQLLHAVGMP